MLLTPKYNYREIRRLQTDEGRKYVTAAGNKVPSVTTILDKTADKTFLYEWQQRVGKENASRQTKEAAGLGTKLHNSIEKYILGQDYEITGTNLSHTIAKRMTDVMIEKGLSQVNEVWGTEVGLYTEGLYAGTADCIGLYNGVPSIIDFKNSKKIKKREWITDYFLQAAAYSLSHNEMYGTDINQLVILMVDREGNFQDFIVSGEEYTAMVDKWLARLCTYYKI